MVRIRENTDQEKLRICFHPFLPAFDNSDLNLTLSLIFRYIHSWRYVAHNLLLLHSFDDNKVDNHFSIDRGSSLSTEAKWSKMVNGRKYSAFRRFIFDKVDKHHHLEQM